MSMLARYKKGGGIMELVKLIESSGEPKRSQLLNMVRAEDAAFAAEVESKLFTWDLLKMLPENVVAEIVSATAPKFLAMAFIDESPEFVALCERCVGKNFAEYKSEKEVVAANPPNPSQIAAARQKMIGEARKLEASGAIKLAGSSDPGAPASIGAPGTGAPVGQAVAGAGTNPNTGVPSGPVGSASADGGTPSIETFNMEPPPPGLMGERFEVFIKTNLGLK